MPEKRMAHSSFLIHHLLFAGMQELIIVLIFAVALGYLGRRAYRSFSKKEAGCGKGCGCAADSDATKRPMKQKLQI